jgi:FkbM family methyltransferase
MKNQVAWLKSLPFPLAIGLIFLSLTRKIFRIPVAFSFAQGAEDLIIPYLATNHFSITGTGRYVDVGCNAPVRYSNTFELYLRGWRGLNIDANEDLISECKRVRKEDVSIQAAVSDSVREVTFHEAEGSLMSTIDEAKIDEWKNLPVFSEKRQRKVFTRTLTSILDEHWTHGRSIDLLTIDVEGHDFRVLKSLDIAKYRPKIIVIEMHNFEGIRDSEIYQHLSENGYMLKFFAVMNAYFVDAREG